MIWLFIIVAVVVVVVWLDELRFPWPRARQAPRMPPARYPHPEKPRAPDHFSFD